MQTITAPRPRPWLAAALAVLTLGVVIVVAGMPPRDVAVAPTQAPTQAPTPVPSPGLTPATTATAEPRPTQESSPYDTGFGVTVDRTALNPWTRVRVIPGGNPTLYGKKSLNFAFEACSDDCGPSYAINVTIGTRAEGIIVGWTSTVTKGAGCHFDFCVRDEPLVVRGKTTDQLADAWAARFGAAVTSSFFVREDLWTILEYKERAVAIVVVGDHVVAVRLDDYPALPAGGIKARLAQFLSVIRFTRSGISNGRIGDLEITMPGNWTVATEPTSLQVWEGGGEIGGSNQQINMLRPGNTLAIKRPVGEASKSFQITGGNLDELVASIDAGLGDVTGRRTTIGGALGYRWSVPSTSLVHTLTAIAVLEWNGAFYVLQEHYQIGAALHGTFDLLLGNVTLH